MKNDEIVTSDLSRFGYREIDMCADLLKEYAKNGADFLGDGTLPYMNTNSGNVFLCDEDMNVGMLNSEGKLAQFFSCSECGNEDFDATEGGEYEFKTYEGYCSHECADKNT